MNKILLFLSLCLLCATKNINAQTNKLLTEINSIQTKEVVTLKYNSKNQLIYLEERGPVILREFTFKYDKNTNQLTECLINRDKGEMITASRFIYDNEEYVTEEVKSSGKQLRKMTEYNKIYIDTSGRLNKTTFDDGKLWEKFSYDNSNNLSQYIVYSAFGKEDIITGYSFDTQKSIFSNTGNIPSWFWALHMNNMKWCSEFIGKNNAIEVTVQDNRFGTETTEISYDYDTDGYPLRQYYDRKLVKEFKYKII